MGTTVVEAQESGEQCGIADDVRYALDGLAAGPRARRDGAVALAEVAATRRGRLVLRCAPRQALGNSHIPNENPYYSGIRCIMVLGR